MPKKRPPPRSQVDAKRSFRCHDGQIIQFTEVPISGEGQNCLFNCLNQLGLFCNQSITPSEFRELLAQHMIHLFRQENQERFVMLAHTMTDQVQNIFESEDDAVAKKCWIQLSPGTHCLEEYLISEGLLSPEDTEVEDDATPFVIKELRRDANISMQLFIDFYNTEEALQHMERANFYVLERKSLKDAGIGRSNQLRGLIPGLCFVDDRAHNRCCFIQCDQTVEHYSVLNIETLQDLAPANILQRTPTIVSRGN